MTARGVARVPAQRAPAGRPGELSRWHLLLAVPVLAPLFTPLYNRLEPRLLGVPFYYWCQVGFVVLTIVVTTFVYQATKRRP